MQVKNIKGTSERNCVCDTWLQHWEKYNKNGNNAGQCFATDCCNIAEVGAHVHKVTYAGLDTRTEYIVPFCTQHNLLGSDALIELDTDSLMDLALANQSDTCG